MNKRNIIFLIVIIAINIVFNAKYQLHYDEAYYWVFSQHLSLSYFDHPPLLAYMIKLSSIFGHNQFAVRFPALVTTTITVIMIYKLALKMYDHQTANIAMFLALCSPIIEATFFMMTPDSPLMMFWGLSLYFAYCGIFEGRDRCFYIMGFTSGLGLLSKYTMVLFFPAVGLFLVFSKRYRSLLLKKELYLSAIIAVVVFSPVIYWNYTHHWVSFLFQFHHGIDLKNSFNIGAFTDYLGGQLVIGGVPIFLVLLYLLVRRLRMMVLDDKQAFLFWSCIFVLGFFGYRALFQHMEANWPAPAYVSGVILVGVFVRRYSMGWVNVVAFTLIAIVIIVTKFPMVFAVRSLYNKPEIQVVNAFFGNRELINYVKPHINADEIILACDYGNASRAWFYLNKPVYVLDKFKFSHMYRYWNDSLVSPIKSAIYICDSEVCDTSKSECEAKGEIFVPLRDYFKTVKLDESATYNNLVGRKSLYIYQVNN